MAGGFWAVYRQPRLLVILVMGFASGLPLALTGATLGVRLVEAHVSLADIGFFALVQIAYNLKLLWAPFLDTLPVPLLTRRLGRRRSWLVVFALLLMAAILALGLCDPRDKLDCALAAVLVAFLSASQDIVIDAYRVEALRADEQGAGAAATQMGYRLGMIASSAGALFLATAFGWVAAYGAMAGLMLIGVAVALAAPEPAAVVIRPPGDALGLAATVIAPFRDFARRRGWWVLLLFVVLYKLGDAMSGHMASPFYITIGFSKNEIASISKLLGVVAAMAGVALGGLMVYRLGVMRALLVGAAVQIVSNLLYIVQDSAGHSVAVLSLTIGLENLAGGIGSAAFVAYLSGLCSPAYTATQYALLSALALVGRNICAATGGVLAERLGWAGFFALAALLVLPGLAMLVWLMRRPTLGRPLAPA